MRKKVIFFYTAITLIFFGLLLKMEYATDTYSVFNFNSKEILMQFANSGRFVTAIVGSIVKIIKMPETIIYLSSYFLGIFCCIFSQYKLYKIIEKDIKSETLKIIIPTLIIVNTFSIELFLFIEKGIMWFSVLLSIYAVENVIKFFEITKKEKNKKENDKKKKYKYLIYSSIFMFLANCSYQGTTGIFVSILLVYILKYSGNIKEFFKNNVIVFLIYGIPAFLDVVLIKLLKTSRINGQILLLESLEKIFKNTISMIVNMYNIIPKYLYILLILFTFACFCCKILEEKKKDKYKNIAKFIYILFGITFVSVIPQIVQPTNSIWLVPRTTYCFASCFGIIILYLSMNYETKNIIKLFVILSSIVLILFNLVSFIKIEKDRFIVNKKDEEVTRNIISKIEEYEKITGNYIDKIAIYEDKNLNYTYTGIFATGDINIKCYFADWSTTEILKYYLKRDLEVIQKDNVLEKYFLENNWDEFSYEQIVLNENVLNLCKY